MSAVDLRKALLVDDDKDIVPQGERVLRRCGVVDFIHCRKMGAAGARIASGEPVDFILVDVDLEEIRGENVAELLSGGDSTFSRIPVLFVANVSNRGDVAALREAGCFHFLMKPLNDNILEQKIRELALKSFDPEKERETVSTIHIAIAAGDLSGAEELLKPVLRRYPASPAFQVLLAELFYERGDYRSADSIISKTIKIDSEYQPALNLQARIQEKLEALDSERRAQAEKAQTESNYAQALELNSQALAAVKEGNHAEATRLYCEALVLSTGFERRHTIVFNYAVCLFRAGNFAEARERCNEAAECAPEGYDKPATLLQKIAEAEAAQAAAKSASPQAGDDGFFVAGMEVPPAVEQASSNLDPEEEARILRFIMFEGKY